MTVQCTGDDVVNIAADAQTDDADDAGMYVDLDDDDVGDFNQNWMYPPLAPMTVQCTANSADDAANDDDDDDAVD